MGRLVKRAPGIWTVRIPHSLMGLQLGSQMTVMQLADGALVLHSPVPLDAELRSELDDLGPVRALVSPNVFHHLFIAEAAAWYPEATLLVPKELHRKRKDLPPARSLTQAPGLIWGEEMVAVGLRGLPRLNEWAFLHRASKTLVLADLIFNLGRPKHLWTALYLRFGGVYGKPGCTPVLRSQVADKEDLATSIDFILGFEIDRILPAHGEMIDQEPKEVLRQAFEWLRR
ncbi:MAG: DUF4336 domain-containing protein [bacterium]|nr:DUF4336 domain-containing protein [bacterium]